MSDIIIKNYGVSFGQNFPGVLFVSGFLLVVLIVLAYREKKVSLWVAVIGGGLNLWERLTMGYVVDYWKIPGIPLYNNVNDWLIFGGIVWYLIETTTSKK